MLDEIDQLREIERLWQNRGDTELQDRLRVDVQVRGENDDRNRGIRTFKFLNQPNRISVWQRVIQDRQIRPRSLPKPLGIGAGTAGGDFHSARLKQFSHRGQEIFFIIYYFALPLLIGYARPFMEKRVIGPVNLAYLFALSQFFMAWIVAGLYVRAAARFDKMAADVVSQSDGSGR